MATVLKLQDIFGKFNISTIVNYSQKCIRKLHSYFFSVHDSFNYLCKRLKESLCHNLLLQNSRSRIFSDHIPLVP
jgi:hypothetical protein